MTDIVERLREAANGPIKLDTSSSLMLLAAIEIAQLRREVAHLKDLVQAYSDMAKSR